MIKVECTHCGQKLEGDHSLLLEPFVICPACQEQFIPRVKQSPVASPKSVEESSGIQADKIRKSADHFLSLSAVLFWLGITVLAGAAVAVVYNSTWPAYCALGTGLITWSLGLYVIGQIIHIRANTHK